MAVGEAAHRKGEDGARRAKKWLDATTRVRASWTNEGDVIASRLSFAWPFGGQPFSFDLGGLLKGGEYENHHFMAEVKAYDAAQDQGTHYDDWLAKCYVVMGLQPAWANHLMWITWSPFRITDWPKLMTAEYVERALLVDRNKKRVFDADKNVDVSDKIDRNLCQQVADRLWLIVLSSKQESLVISAEHRGWLHMREIQEES